MMHTVLIAMVLAVALSAPAQEPATQPAPQPASQTPPPEGEPAARPATAAKAPTPLAGSDWRYVQALPVGTSVYVSAKTRHTACKLQRVDADSFTCFGAGKDAVFPRSEIKTIQIAHRGRSTLVATVPGDALIVGGAVGLAADRGCSGIACNLLPGAVLVGGVAIASIGAPIGALTDFTRSTVYRAP
jgi:hypothetical protein